MDALCGVHEYIVEETGKEILLNLAVGSFGKIFKETLHCDFAPCFGKMSHYRNFILTMIVTEKERNHVQV